MPSISVEPRKKLLQVKLTDREHQILSEHSQRIGVTVSELVRDYVKSLPSN